MTALGYKLGVVAPSLPDVRDWPYPARGAGSDLPSEHYLPTKEQTFQGGQGSCLPHFVTQAIEDHLWLEQGVRTDLSIPFVYYEARRRRGWQDRDTGSFMRDAIAVARELGIPPSVVMPYDEDDWTTPPSAEAFRVAARNRAAEFYACRTSLDVASAIADGHPVGICFNVYENIERAGYDGMLPPPQGALLGAHCWELDGFVRRDGALLFLVKNWWASNPDGSPWGFPHPLAEEDARFERHTHGRCWMPAAWIDGRQAYDGFAVLRFPLERTDADT